MGSTSPQIKALISLAYEYQVRRTEKNLQTLQRQLQILCVVSDLSIFEPSCMETLEFYVCLEQLLTEVDSKSPLAWKIMNLLSHISSSSSIRIALRDEIQLIPVLTNFLLPAKLNKDKSQKTLQLLEVISYGIKLHRLEGWLMKLIPYLVSSILNAGVHDDSSECAIILLANLCRGNPPAITSLCELSERKSLVRSLTSLRSPSLKVQLLVSEIMLYVNMDHSKLDSEQIVQTLDLLFTVATDSYAENDIIPLQLSTDVFKEILNHSYLQEAIKSFGKFESQCQNLLSYVSEENQDKCTGTLFEFLSLLVQMEHADLQGQLVQILEKVLPWLGSRKCGSGALRLFQTLLQVSDDSLISSHIDHLVSTIKGCLFLKDDFSFSYTRLKWLSSLLDVTEKLCLKEPSMHFKLSVSLSSSSFTDFMKHFLVLIEPVHRKLKDCDSDGSSSSGYSSLDDSSSLNPSKRFKDSYSKSSLMEECAEVVVRLLMIAKTFAVHKPEFQLEHDKMLNNPKIMKYLVCCQRSRESSLVAIATKLLSNGAVTNDSMAMLVKAQTDANLNSDLLPGIETLTHSERANVTNGSIVHSSLPQLCEENVDLLISRLNGSSEKLDLKDIPLADIMELYEYKLAALSHNEMSLEEALSAADKHIRQLKQTLMQSRAEGDRVRCLLQVWEGRLQEALKEKAGVENTVQEIQNSSRKLREQLVKEKTDVERQLGRKQAEVSSLNRELTAKEEEAKKIHRQFLDSQKENKHIQNNLKEEQEKVQKLRDTQQRITDEQKKGKKECEELEKQIIKLEKSQTQMKNKNNELELVIRSHEQTIAEKEAEADELMKTNSTLKRIQDMIHNMSKNPT